MLNQSLDLVFCCDCTNSMGAYLKQAKETISALSKSVGLSGEKSIHFGLVAFRDHPPQDESFITQTWPLTESREEIEKNLGSLTAQGGGDAPEALTCALYEAYSMSFRENSVRIVVLISDAPPHGLGELLDGFPDGCPCGLDPLVIARKMVKKNIILYTVGVEPTLSCYTNGCSFYRALAEMTGGRYLSLGNALLLSDVIVGGSLEELELQTIGEMVMSESRAMRTNSTSMSINELEEGVTHKLQNIGLMTHKLNVSHQNEFEYTDAMFFLTAETLSDAVATIAENKALRKKESQTTMTMNSYDPGKYANQSVTFQKSLVSKEQVSKIMKKKTELIGVVHSNNKYF